MADNCLWQDVNGGKRVPKSWSRPRRPKDRAYKLEAIRESIVEYGRAACRPITGRPTDAELDNLLADIITAAGDLGIPQDEDELPPTVHKRKCWDCGTIQMHADSQTPYVLCRKCGSQDTRLVNT